METKHGMIRREVNGADNEMEKGLNYDRSELWIVIWRIWVSRRTM